MDRDEKMAETAASPAAPLTTEAFLADRMNFWGRFTHFAATVVVLIVIGLILMTVFLV